MLFVGKQVAWHMWVYLPTTFVDPKKINTCANGLQVGGTFQNTTAILLILLEVEVVSQPLKPCYCVYARFCFRVWKFQHTKCQTFKPSRKTCVSMAFIHCCWRRMWMSLLRVRWWHLGRFFIGTWKQPWSSWKRWTKRGGKRHLNIALSYQLSMCWYS